jgi:hypothetical protein
MWSYIKKAINTNLSKALDVLIDETVGDNLDSASSTGTVHAKLKDLKANPSSIIKSIQRGTSSAPSPTSDTRTVTISSVDISKSVVLIDGLWSGSGNAPYLSAITSTSVSFLGLNLSDSRVFSWQVIEYV